MVAKPKESERKFHIGWRGIAVGALATLGIISLTGFMLVHWTERQILTTDNWVKIVGPLPQNEQVSSALSTYSVNQLFKTTDLEAKITQALPDKASFLGPTISEQVQERLTKRTQQFVESDRFTNVWTAANRAAHQRLVNSARGEEPATKAPAKFNLNLSSFKTTVSSFIDQRSTPLEAAQTSGEKGNVGLVVNLKTSVNTLKSYIRKVDFLNGTLGLAALVCLIGALTLSYKRRRLLIVMSLVVVTIALLQLIGAKAVRPIILDQIQEASYRPAIGVIYDSLLTTFKRAATAVFAGSLLIFLIAFFTKPSFVNSNEYLVKQLKQFKKSAFYNWVQQVRQALQQYRWQIIIGVVLLGLALMAFFANSLDGQSLIRSLLFIVLTVELINLVALRPKEAPMKH